MVGGGGDGSDADTNPMNSQLESKASPTQSCTRWTSLYYQFNTFLLLTSKGNDAEDEGEGAKKRGGRKERRGD